MKIIKYEDGGNAWSFFLWELWIYFPSKCVSGFVCYVSKKVFSIIQAYLFVSAVSSVL